MKSPGSDGTHRPKWSSIDSNILTLQDLLTELGEYQGERNPYEYTIIWDVLDRVFPPLRHGGRPRWEQLSMEEVIALLKQRLEGRRAGYLYARLPTPAQRWGSHITLLPGTALRPVAPDPVRPFHIVAEVVEAGGASASPHLVGARISVSKLTLSSRKPSEAADVSKGPEAAWEFERRYRGLSNSASRYIPPEDLRNIVLMGPELWRPEQLSLYFQRLRRPNQVGIVVVVKTEFCASNGYRACAVTTAVLEKSATPLLEKFMIFMAWVKHPAAVPVQLNRAKLKPKWDEQVISEYDFDQGPGSKIIFLNPQTLRSVATDARLMALNGARFDQDHGAAPVLERKIVSVFSALQLGTIEGDILRPQVAERRPGKYETIPAHTRVAVYPSKNYGLEDSYYHAQVTVGSHRGAELEVPVEEVRLIQSR